MIDWIGCGVKARRVVRVRRRDRHTVPVRSLPRYAVARSEDWDKLLHWLRWLTSDGGGLVASIDYRVSRRSSFQSHLVL